LQGQTAAPGPVTIARVATPVTIDGVVAEGEWKDGTRFETWYETNPGDNVPPPVKNVGLAMYDGQFFYFAIEMADPEPGRIAAPFGDHDNISGNTDDYAGVVIDPRNDGKSGVLFLANARGIQYDAITDDTERGEDNAPDFFWEAAAKIHERGWTLEGRIPFSQLRYDTANPEQWGFAFYRNHPRERRAQYFTSRLPRGANCFVCSWGKINGLHDLPTGNHFVLAPYVTANELGETRSGLGDFVNHPVTGDAGLDFKWTPTADTAIDATINPDFSQIESDVAVISTNERFAIFIPEKRPFFLEGVDLLDTPIDAVYTRTITAPRWGTRVTGKKGRYAYAFLVANDEGGGSVIIPSATGSDFAEQDFSSTALIARVRRDVGQRSFVSFLGTSREYEGGGHNRVFGPDFQWRFGESTSLTGQFLYSTTQTPDRPDLASEWDGRSLSGHAAYARYSYSTAKVDLYASADSYGKEFRADNGFVPQVGHRSGYGEGGYTWRPTGFFSRIRGFGIGEYQQTQDGQLLYRSVSAGAGMDGKRRSFWRFRAAHETVLSGDELFDRDRLYYQMQIAVSRLISFVSLDGWLGDEVDFTNNRPGRGANVNLSATLRPTNHLSIGLTNGFRWLNVGGDRLFTSQVERVRATYTFNSRMFVRAIVQNQRTNRNVALYGSGTDQHSGSLASQVLFAYKLNWQTVFFAGLGDLREATAFEGDLEPSNRQFFAKVSYAFQR
jgi:hypothetical protein